MQPILPHWLTILLLGVLAVVFAANLLARAGPNARWLQQFTLGPIKISTEERARRKRRLKRIAGLEMILAGLIALGIWAFWRSR